MSNGHAAEGWLAEVGREVVLGLRATPEIRPQRQRPFGGQGNNRGNMGDG
jgi:hypothetical protein